jgi:Tfp pilus assembly protein PilX
MRATDHSPGHRRQRGVVLLIALIILIAMTLGGVALVRSVDTANLVAGNLSFRESAVLAGERATEQAVIGWLQPMTIAKDPSLHADSAANGYRAVRQDPPAGTAWDTFWNTTLAAQAITAAPDAANNTVSYVIHRLCDGAGAPHTVSCSKPPSNANSGGSFSAGAVSTITSSQVYYRITARIAGPRSTVAYVQTIVAL